MTSSAYILVSLPGRSISTWPMKCQSFWLLDPSRLSLTVVSATDLPGGCACASAEAVHNTHNSKVHSWKNVSIRTRCAGSRSVSRAAGPPHDVAEQEDRSGNDDSRRRAPRRSERRVERRFDRDRQRRRDRARLLSQDFWIGRPRVRCP